LGMAASATEPDEKDPGQARLSPHVPGFSSVIPAHLVVAWK